jgi:diguanylate cyclase (GGDEF)-like protein
MFDVDHFKQVNDCYGHAVGDQVLRHVTRVAANTVRGTDTLARYGGEEFVLVAAETDRSEALRLAERVREALRSSDVPLNQVALRVTASFGVALMRAEDTEPEDVLRRADEALFAAKFAGRDRVGAETSATGKAQTRSCEVQLRSEGSGRAQGYLRRTCNPR